MERTQWDSIAQTAAGRIYGSNEGPASRKKEEMRKETKKKGREIKWEERKYEGAGTWGETLILLIPSVTFPW